MDNGEKEKAIIRDLKETVKQNSGRRKAAAQASSQRDRVIRIAPRALSGSVENSFSSLEPSHQLATPPLDHGSSEEDAGSTGQNGAAVSVS